MPKRPFLSFLLLLPWAPRARAQDAAILSEARPAAPGSILAAPVSPIPFVFAPLSAPAVSAPSFFAAPAAAPASAAALVPAAAAEIPALAALPSGIGPAAPGTQASASAPSAPNSEGASLDALFDGAGEEGIRRIRLAPTDGDPARGLESARAYLAALARTPHLGTARESPAVERLRPLFRLRTRNTASLDKKKPHDLVIQAAGYLPKFGDQRYADLTNGSRFSTTDKRGAVHHFVAVRALRKGYSVRVDMLTGAFSTEKYVSDELLFEVTYDPRGNAVSRKFVGPLVLSTSDDILVAPGTFVFEDGRVYSPAPGKLIVSGTVIADFRNKPKNPGDRNAPGDREKVVSYRNALAELDVDPETGIPRVKRDSAGDPAWHYMSPIGSRVKNGMVLSTGRGEEVVALFRFITEPPQRSLVQRIVDRLPFRMRKTDRIPLGYSLIRMSFPDYAAFLKYDTAHLMEDMLHPEALGHLSRPHPSETGVLLATADLREPYAGDPRVTMSGFGPGAKPARVTMRGDGDVYLEESFGAAPVKIGRVPPAEREAFVLKADEPKWLFLGHQLRGYQLFGAKFRDYNAFAWLTDAAMSRVERVRNALMSADSPLDAGEHSMIVDLARHNYPMGAEVMENGEYHISYGASDKHTGAAKLDVMALLREMSDGSPETREGLAYRPGATPAVSASGK